MSIIAQTRLALLSQKCLSTTAWRYDVRVGYGYIQNSQYQVLSKKNKHMLAGCRKLIVERQNSTCQNHYGICKLREYNTPKQKTNPALNRILVKELITEIDNANLALLINKNTRTPHGPDLLRDPILTSRFTSKTTNEYDICSHLHRKFKYLLGGEQNRYPYVTLNPFTSNKSSQFNVFGLRHQFKRDNHNNDGNDSRDNFINIKHLVTMLSILGLFKTMTADEIDEEKAKLSDEQKVKKMKPAELLIAKGVLSMCDQDYTKASELFHQALHIAQVENNEEQETLVLNLLAANFFESGDLESAEKLFIDLIKRLIAHDVEPTDPAILELSLKLASIYSKNQATHDKAMKGYKFVISSLLSNLRDEFDTEELEIHELSEDKKNELALLGWSYDWFAKYLLSINDYNGASYMLQRALKISSKVLGPLHDQTLILLNDVGTTLAINDSPEEGKSFIKKAVEGAIEGQSRELASFYVNLGLVNLKLKRLSEAKRYCEYSIELASKNREHHNSQEVIKLSRTCLDEVERLLEREVDNQ